MNSEQVKNLERGDHGLFVFAFTETGRPQLKNLGHETEQRG